MRKFTPAAKMAMVIRRMAKTEYPDFDQRSPALQREILKRYQPLAAAIMPMLQEEFRIGWKRSYEYSLAKMTGTSTTGANYMDAASTRGLVVPKDGGAITGKIDKDAFKHIQPDFDYIQENSDKLNSLFGVGQAVDEAITGVGEGDFLASAEIVATNTNYQKVNFKIDEDAERW